MSAALLNPAVSEFPTTALDPAEPKFDAKAYDEEATRKVALEHCNRKVNCSVEGAMRLPLIFFYSVLSPCWRRLL